MQTKVGRLLQIIPTQGDEAFGELIKALVATQQEHLAEQLDHADLMWHFKNLAKKSAEEKVSEICM